MRLHCVSSGSLKAKLQKGLEVPRIKRLRAYKTDAMHPIGNMHKACFMAYHSVINGIDVLLLLYQGYLWGVVILLCDCKSMFV